MRPMSTPSYIKMHQESSKWFLDNIESIRSRINNFHHTIPDVSVVIPAYNEQESILRTISSLVRTDTSLKVEILVVNNNSTDKTQFLLDQSGVRNIIEYKKGVKHARNAGLLNARGNIIINADADSVYSPYWVELLARPLILNETIACSFGKFAFLPNESASRLPYFLYETLGDIYKYLNKRGKEEAMYVYGCSSAFRKHQGIAVDGYEHPPGANEDGYLALKLKAKFGSLNRVTNKRSLVWTSNRRLIDQGGLWGALTARFNKISNK